MVKYVWRSGGGENSCAGCQELDGQVFDSLEDVPGQPHPNCQCCVEEVEDNNSKEELEKKEKQIDSNLKESGEIIEKIEDNVNYTEKKLQNILPDSKGEVKAIVNDMLDGAYQVQETLQIFKNNYDEMIEANWIGADKYFHAKANAESAQIGEIGEKTAEFLSDLREFAQVYTDTIFKGYTLQDIKKDMDEDQNANFYGRMHGKENPDEDPRELVKVWRPRGLPERY